MEEFLSEVAADLYARYGVELSDRAILFPSRRARLFFVDALARIAEQPMWQPEWVSIDDLMTEISGIQVGDRLRLITELYKIYTGFHHETFDKFYFWGDLLLNDFDTIDKYRIDAKQLFQNLIDIKEIEADISYLTPVQQQIIRDFWSALGPEAELSDEKRRFLAIWRTLYPIYEQYRARLTELGFAYNGMVQRAAADRIDSGDFQFKNSRRYVIAGFNALSECEKRLFKFLSTAAEADFYWDYDSYYKDQQEQEAGMFVRQNLVQFPPAVDLPHDNLRKPKTLTSVATVSNAVQCKYVTTILRELAKSAPLDKQTAIVLTDENLLLPLLYALPPEIGQVNVTMGYPLRQSLAYTFVERLVELQAHRRTKSHEATFYHTDVNGILAHPYVVESDAVRIREIQDEIVRDRRISIEASKLGCNDLLCAIFQPAEDWQMMSDWLLRVVSAVAQQPYEGDDARQRVEFLAVIAEEINKLRNSLDACELEITTEVYASLLRRHLQTLRIPFEGEPLEGVQVMGILETRNLDFKNVILLSMNDDNFPGNHMAQASYIPYNLRSGFELPTPEHHEGVFAYYFYRLIQRAEKIWMLYCAHADDKSTGEPSRYIYQLDYESGFPMQKIEVGVDVNLAETEPIEVAKTPEIMARIERYTNPESKAALSPTAFFRYVACPLRFYFQSVANLESDDELSEEIDAPMFGTILHAAVQKLYTRILGESHPAETLKALIRSGAITTAVEESINENYLQDTKASVEDYSGNLILVKDIVTRYLKGGVVAYDVAHDGFAVSGLEAEVEYLFEFETNEGRRQLRFRGYADRIDKLDDGTLRVVDYKTGSPHLEFDGLDKLFHGEGKQRLSNVLQTLLYAMMLHHKRDCEVEPVLYYVRTMNRPDYSPSLVDKETKTEGAHYSFYRVQFEELVRETLSELFNPALPFRQCEDADTCKFCDFNTICKR